SLPKVEALIKGLKLSRFDETGGYLDEAFSNNPAWVLLDLIRRCGWKIGEIDSASFARAAAFCEEPISSEDLNGTQVSIPRFQCNLVLAKRRTASDVIRGVKTGSGLMLRYGRDGSLECLPETALALQQPTKRPGSNAPAPLNGGWPVYEFGDGTSGRSGILRRSNGEPAFRVWSRSSAETPNRYSAEFQDEFNYYQQDSLSIVDTEDAVATRQELSASLTALGLPNFSQAGRVIRMSLNRGLRGNTFVEFETSLLGLGVLPGDLITITYLKSGFDRQPFRVMSMRPGLNFATCVITAQIHEDEWYLGTGETDLGLLGGGYEASISQGAPRPLQGNLLEGATSTWKIGEKRLTGADGATRVLLSAGFLVPPASISSALTPPMLSVSATTSATGGSLRGGTTFYYCVSAVDAQGHESQPSFVVRATTPEGTDTCSATLRSVSFPSAATGCLLYRGTSPDQLLKIGGTRPLGATLTDGGDSETTGVPADRNYHHAAFYWRFELLPSTPCTSAGPDFIGNSTLGLIDDEYRGRLVRIVEGKGMGQEREIARNDSQSLRVSIDWEDVPDQTSRFVISEESWKLGALARTSPAEFEVPNRDGAIVQICGRAANVRNVESAYELAPIARHALLGGGGVGDSEVPSRLSYGLSCPGNGTIEVAGLSFESLSNTRSVTTATLTLHSVDELGTTEAVTAQALGSTETTVSIGGGGLGVEPGAFVIIGREIIRVTEVSGSELTLERGQLGSSATSHEASTPVMPLVKRVEVLSFPRDFFGTLASGSYRFLTSWPNQRIVASELFATNALGNSPVRTLYFANTSTWGIRTLSGGQFTLQVDGTLAIQDGAVPPISVDTGCAVVDVFAKCQGAPELVPLELRVTVDGMPWCSLTVPPGEATSNIVSGLTLRPLRAGSLLGLDIVSLGASVDSAPGRDLTVTVRV
ncbi:MAG TPA: phage tail protein, partial [Bryobacteraceae bacterium]|nr:phage tail protein [Bryobacteraceae bacterium]